MTWGQRLMEAKASCRLCEIPLTERNTYKWGKHWCRACWLAYIAYRREFKREYGRYPTMKEFREGDG